MNADIVSNPYDMIHFNKYEKNLIDIYGNRTQYRIKHIFLHENDKVLSHAVAFVRDFNGKKIGGIGMLHVRNSYEEFETMIKKAENWFTREQVLQYYVPIDFNTFYKYRIATDYLENPPFLLEQEINPSVSKLVERYDFDIKKKYYSFVVNNPYAVVNRLGSYAARAEKNDINIIQADIAKLNDNILKDLYDITNDAFADAFLYERINFNEFSKLYKPLIKNYYGVKLFLARVGNNNVGYLFVVNDKFKENRWVVKTIAVKREYSGLGTGTLLTYKLYREAVRLGIKELIHAYMKENISTKKFSETFGKIYREYTLYGKHL